ncbi:MAG: PadR family transcriptional regulator, partial [Pyrobaculum sp.]
EEGREFLNKLMEDEEFQSLIKTLHEGPDGGDLMTAIRDELVYIDEVIDEVETNDVELLREVLALLHRLEEKVSAKLKKAS